jgi:protein phosphatase
MQPILLYTRTDTGKVRRNNEDSVASFVMDYKSFGMELSYAVLVVADGMGGHEMGEVASATASEKFIETVTQSMFSSWHNSEKIKFREILLKAVEAANNEVWKISMHRPQRIGTTLTGAIISGNYAAVINVGDSRAYIINPSSSIIQVTKDHTAVQEMVDAGMISREQAIFHPRRNVLTKSIGTIPSVHPDFFETALQDQILLLCSDGLYGMIDDDEICNTVSRDIFKSAEALISAANERGGEDNVSVVLARHVI